MTWVESAGGPLILMSEALLPYWGGSEPPPPGTSVTATFRWSVDGPATDYDCACDVAAYAGVIRIGDGQGLVLGDMPMPAAWWPDGGGFLVRWMAAPNDEAVLNILRGLSLDLAWDPEAEFEFRAGPLVLFDSAWPGSDVRSEAIRLELAAGRYRVDTALLETEDISIVLHRFVASAD